MWQKCYPCLCAQPLIFVTKETWEINHGKVEGDMHVRSLLQVFAV